MTDSQQPPHASHWQSVRESCSPEKPSECRYPWCGCERKACGCRLGYACCGACLGEKHAAEVKLELARLPPDVRAQRVALNEELERRCAENWQRKYRPKPVTD
jgi:hypothetical protein